MTKVVAVTGARGFIGREICHQLQSLGAVPIGIDRAPDHGGVVDLPYDVITAELGDPSEALEAIGECHSLVDLAWDSLDDYNSDRHYRYSLPLHYDFLSVALGAGVPRIVGIGTCFEYGMRDGALDETITPDPSNSYAFAKHALHTELKLLRQQESFELSWARPFYLFGAASSRRSLYSLLAEAVERGDSEFKMSGGEQLRDYLPVAVAARYIAKLAMLDSGVGAVNICSGQPRSVRGIVESWLSENGWEIDLDLGYYPYASHEPHAFWGNATKLQRVIGGEA